MKHYGDKDGLLLLSYDAVVSCVISNRNYGKTWTFKKRACRRFFKHGNKTIWLRVFKNEAKDASAKFFTSKDLQKYCGVSFYDKKRNPNGNIKQIGSTIYGKRRGRWEWFIDIYALCEAGSVRGIDDVKTDTIVLDEFMQTAEKLKQFRGSMTTNFLDIFFSNKREHKVNIICLGNKEMTTSPIFTYFNITPPNKEFEGIIKYRNGSFIIQQINNKPKETSAYDKKVKDLLQGTPYGNYIYKDEYKNVQCFKKRKTPPTAGVYTQVYINGVGLKISVLNGLFYINRNVETAHAVYCDVLPHKYRRELLLIKRLKKFYSALLEALSDNRVYYDDANTYESIQPFYKWLNV